MSQQEQLALERIADDRGISPSSISNPGQITDTLKRAMQNGHLVSPSTTCPNLPIGCEVAFSAVLIDPEGSEVYAVQGGKLGLGKTALNRIAKALGITWDPIQSNRTDDGKDSCFAAYKAVGFYRHFDGSVMTVTGERSLDLREGSESAKTMKPGDLSQQRKFIAEHAETKAKLRAIRSMGIQTAYTKEELGKPFVIAKLMLTGRVSAEDDPTGELQRILTHNISQSMLGASSALYGGQPPEIAPPGDLPPATATPELAEAKTEVSTEPTFCTKERCFGDESDGHIRACREPKTTATEQKLEAWVITSGPCKGMAIHSPHVTDEALSRLIDGYVFGLERKDTTPQQIEVLKAELKEVETEVQRRRNAAKQQDQY